MKRKYLFALFAVLGIVIALCISVWIFGSMMSNKNSEKDDKHLHTDAFGFSYYAIEPISYTKYESSQYTVGSDISGGDYVAFPTQSYGSKYKVTSDQYGFNILREEFVGDIWTISLLDGEFVFLENCYLVKLNETPTYTSDYFDITRFDGKDVRLKVGYHIPSGEYVFDTDVTVYKCLTKAAEGETYLQSDYSVTSFDSLSTDSCKYTFCTIYNDEYCSLSGDYSNHYFLTIDKTKDKFEIKEFGVYKVGAFARRSLYC